MSSLNNVEFVSASAGSGKTFTLTEKMAELVKGGLKPENFILTTYTRAAASEFKEKVRSKFYERRLSVTGLDNAVVGTIHSVAHQFLMQYWYLLGISPEISILTDEDKSF
ncbi:MAG: UvrD-helicase domain-containing protein, partial [Bacteroidales bacterium]|nr:UvrD-helicase domain-containing protein [Bacteroidales bacterium]